VKQDEDLPELLLLAHSPHVPSVLFGVALHGTATQLRGNHASDMALRGLHLLVAHLSLFTGVKAGNEKEQPDDEDLATQCSCKVVHEEKCEQYLLRKELQNASDGKDKRQETHEDICQIALLPTDQAAIGRGSRESDDPPITMHVRQRHGLRRLDV
jgi:hypothetical protein